MRTFNYACFISGIPGIRLLTFCSNYCMNKKITWVIYFFFSVIIVSKAGPHGIIAGLENHSVTVSLYGEPLQFAFKQIEEQSEFRFSYSSLEIDHYNQCYLTKTKRSIAATLNAVLSATGLKYVLKGKNIQILTAQEYKAYYASMHNAYHANFFAKTIRGTIRNEKGEPLVNVAVTIKGSAKGTVSDESGKYKIDADPTDLLTFSIVGYISQEITVGDKTTIDVVMANSVNELQEVVVAYGKQKKSTLTGSVAQISGADLMKSPVANVANALQGRLPGLTFQQTSGLPGGDAANFNIRGFGTPLAIVDGVPSDIAQIDPSEIESVTLLKDGTAAMYGFKGANGAIIITTKKGKTGAPVISFNGYAGMQSNTIYPRLANAGEYAELTDEAAINKGSAPVFGAAEVSKWKTGADSTHQSTDWYNAVFRKYAPMSSANINVQGGTETARYFFSAGVLDQQGLLRSHDARYRRYNFRSNTSVKISKRLTAEMSLGGRLENRYGPFTGFSGAGIVNSIIRNFPTNRVYANNNPLYLAKSNIINSVALADAGISGYNRNTWAIFTGIGTLNYDIPYVQGLSAKLSFNYESDNYNAKVWRKQFQLYTYNTATKTYDVASTENAPSSLFQKAFQGGVQSNIQLSLNYDHVFNSAHHFTGLLLLERRKTNGSNFTVSRDFQVDVLDQLQLGVSTNQGVGVDNDSKFFYQTAYQGYVGRINYDYKGKYLLELGGRYDYSWKFPDRGGFFPEISAGWVINKESFFYAPVVNNLKLRVSWVKAPDDADFTGFNYLSGYDYPNGSFVFGPGVISNGLGLGAFANPNLTWLVAHTYNAGVDIGVLNNMLTATLDVFYRKRTGRPGKINGLLPGVVGIAAPQQNLNEDNTRGFELQLGFNKKIGNVQLNISPNVAWNRTKEGFIARAPDGSARENYLNNPAYRWRNRIVGYKSVGQFQSQDEINHSPVQDQRGNATLRPGDIKYADINGDDVIDGRDQTVIGRGTYPELQFGLSMSASYKNWDVSVLFAGAGNFNINYTDELRNPFFNNSNAFAFFTDRWHHQDIYNPNSPWVPGKFPSTITNGADNNKLNSDFWWQKGDYLRLKTVEIGYTLPAGILSRAGIKSARLYASGQNLFTITSVKYLDPEAVANSRGDYYPQQKVYTLGITVKF